VDGASFEQIEERAWKHGFTLDSLDSTQTERVRSALVERMRQHQRPDGFYVAATALLAVANR
jgi:hypothetical protein